ncbi:MAG: phospholipase D family protein [Rhodanobacteraceae bacterium]|nr:phospholipase D family protein [Rhodanobacteraceae bacterium]
MQVREPRALDSALLPATSGPIAAAVAAIGLREGESSYRLTQSNTDALALQIRSAQLAQVSLDLKYYMWLNDVSGRLLSSELLRAADRGVRVRVLLDDTYVRTHDLEFAALDSHPNVELRVYNPWRTRGNKVGNAFEFVLGGFRLNHRMHNKAWITDGLLAIVGGRNVGDEYYGLNDEFDFRDLGVLLAGHAVLAASADFDRYWNSPIVIPLAAIPKPDGGPTLAQAREALERERTAAMASPEFAPVLAAQDLVVEVRSRQSRLVSDRSRVVNDPPDKWLQRSDVFIGVAADLRTVIDAAEQEVILVSPYFIPGREGMDWLRGLRERGVRVRVLTNSLDATDVPAVHGAYSNYRHRLLRAGIELHELKPLTQARPHSTFRGSSRASLHTKAVLVDGRVAFVGSFNLDPRSTWINTEMGALIDDARFAEIVRANIERSLTPEHSYQLSLEGDKLVWTDTKDGQPRQQFHEPSSSWTRRIVAALARVLPVEEQL